MTRTKFLIELEEYWLKKYGPENSWASDELTPIDLFDACQKLGFFKGLDQCLLCFQDHRKKVSV